MKAKVTSLLLIFILIASFNTAMACDACQAALKKSVLEGQNKSPHAEEYLRLIKSADTINTQPAVFKDAPAGIKTDARPQKSDNSQYLAVKNLPDTSYVEPGTKPDKKFTIEMSEGETAIGNGVIYKGFLINNQLPGPMFEMEEGDVIEFTVVNKGTVPHGVSIHAAYTQTSKYYGKIQPGETRTHVWKASYPGVYMYHCAPGGHAIPMHVLNGQYGMMVVKPKKNKYRMEEILGKKPDIELFLLQHELYASGKQAVEGDALYQLFNGKLFRYAESPVKAQPGDFVRINFLNVGPNLVATFHIVGIIWDFAYWQGNPAPENTFVGGQSVIAGPTDSWVVDFRIPNDEGVYLMLNHGVGATSRGSIGAISAKRGQDRTPRITADGPVYSAEELKELKAKAVRSISPFEPGTDDLANPVKPFPGDKKMQVMIKGNSFWPKVIEIPVGTTVEWTNEDVFTFADGEFAGVHNVVAYEGPEIFAAPLLGHAEKYTFTFNTAGEYKYLCAPHPYMKGIVRVVKK